MENLVWTNKTRHIIFSSVQVQRASAAMSSVLVKIHKLLETNTPDTLPDVLYVLIMEYYGKAVSFEIHWKWINEINGKDLELWHNRNSKLNAETEFRSRSVESVIRTLNHKRKRANSSAALSNCNSSPHQTTVIYSDNAHLVSVDRPLMYLLPEVAECLFSFFPLLKHLLVYYPSMNAWLLPFQYCDAFNVGVRLEYQLREWNIFIFFSHINLVKETVPMDAALLLL